MNSYETAYNPNPRENANIFSVLVFGYTIPIFKKGMATEIGVEDIFNTLSSDKSSYIGSKLEKHWYEQIERSRDNPKKKPSLFKAIVKTFWFEYLLSGILAGMLDLFLKTTQPKMLGGILDYYTPGSTTTKFEAYMHALAFIGFTLGTSLCLNQYITRAWHSGNRVKIAVCALVYRKAIRLSRTALGDTPTGKFVNLLSNDVARFEYVSLLLQQMWTGPICAAIVIINIYQLAGLPGLAGICITVLMSPLQAHSGKLVAKFRKQIAMKTDERIRLMDEIILGIQVIKMYAWEKPFEKIIAIARKSELNLIWKRSYITTFFFSLNMITTRIALFATLFAITLSKEEITASKVFVLISYFSVLADILSSMFVTGLSLIAEALASIDRLQQILIKDEYKYEQFRNIITDSDEKSKVILTTDNLTARWSTNSTECVLDNINLEINRGQLIGIIGPVGSGKSSLLNTFLGELDIVAGKISARGKLSYASQEPWIFAATIRQNILFGAEFDKIRYKKVIRACALTADLKQFPDGDMTIVGEKGTSLSGGQKSRINLARAIYRDVDIYLLDDPLSAVDIHVSKVLYEECINRFLSDKTRIIVSHQVHYLKNVDNIIILQNGKIEAEGTYKQLSNSNSQYSQLLISEPALLEDDKHKLENTRSMSIHSIRSRTSSATSHVSYKSLPESSIGDSELGDANADQPKMADMQEESSKGKVVGSLLLKYFQSAGSYWNLVISLTLFLLVQISVTGVDYFISIWTSIEETRLQLNLYGATTPVYIGNFSSTDIKRTSSMISVEHVNLFGNNVTGSENGTDLLNNTTPSSTINLVNIASTAIFNSVSILKENPETPTSSYPDWSSETCVYIYGGLILGVILVTLLRSISFFSLVIKCSQNLHNSLFNGIINTKMRFFETNPSGRILNRFSKDTNDTDELIPKVLQDGLELLLRVVGCLLLVGIVNPYCIIVGVVLAMLSNYVKNAYLKSSNDVKRVQGIIRSPLYTHINATLQGLTTIRALGNEQILIDEFDNMQDYNCSAGFMGIAIGSAFGFSLDLISCIFTSVLIFSVLIFDEAMGVNGSTIGLAISQAYLLTSTVQFALRSTSNISNNLMAVERILQYTELPPEPQPDKPKTPPKNWPDEGQIIFDGFKLKYFENGPLIIKNLNLRIKPREKVGIVGRTGAGKTSLVSALFRLAIVDGKLIIDGIDTKDLNLSTLRSKISIIPQDPVLFAGTLRSNLDPFDEYSDEELYRAINNVELNDPKNIINKLENAVMDKGSNYSVGQKQLICLARALLRKNKILVLDEATASVDPQTDSVIQRTLRTKFVDCTVITVAHRLNTIMDSDKVLVMAQGEVAEFDHPHLLLRNKDGIFTKMVEETGKREAERLNTIAKNSYQHSMTLQE